MSVELNVHDDFSTILDGAEAVTVKRRDTADTIAVPKAWRFSSDVAEAAAAFMERRPPRWGITPPQ